MKLYRTQLECGRLGLICWSVRRLKKGDLVDVRGSRRKWIVIHQDRDRVEVRRKKRKTA